MASASRAIRGSAIVALLVAASACGSDGGNARPMATTSSAPARETAAFCAAWKNGAASPSDEEEAALLRLMPPELADAAAVLEPGGEPSTEEAMRASAQISQWVTLNCGFGTDRWVAPPADASLPGLTLCEAGSFPTPDDAEMPEMRATFYGEAARSDPYDGPMLGAFSAGQGNGGFAGDGDPTPVTVRGQDGVAAPITVFQQSIVPELGTVVTWTENGQDVALFGRLWEQERVPDLVALANRLQVSDGRFTLPRDALPAGYEPVFTGRYREEWSLVVSGLLDDYHVRYQPGNRTAMITVSGSETTADEFDAPRFFEFPSERERIDDRDALVGSAWSKDDGPWVVRWRDPDGFSLRVVGIGSNRDDVLSVARQSRELDRAEWEDVVSSATDCPLPVP